MDDPLLILILMAFSITVLIIALLTIKYNEDYRTSDDLGYLVAFSALLLQVILILDQLLSVAFVIILLYAPAIINAKFPKNLTDIRGAKFLFFFGILFFSLGFSYLLFSTDIASAATFFLIITIIYAIMALCFGVFLPYYLIKGGDAKDWVEAASGHLLTTTLISLSDYLFIMFAFHSLESWMNLLIFGIFSIPALITGLFLVILKNFRYKNQFQSIFIYTMVMLFLYLLSYVVISNEFFYYFFSISILFLSITFCIIFNLRREVPI